MARMMRDYVRADYKEKNKEVFEDTERMYHCIKKLKKCQEHSSANQRVFLEGDELLKDKYAQLLIPATVSVSGKRTMEAAERYARGDGKVCVLNFASWNYPGGGVRKGASAQEESLCRISTLYANLNDRSVFSDFYYKHRLEDSYLHNDDCIYTPDVMVFKKDNEHPTLMKEEDWFKVDVITCSAPHHRVDPKVSGISENELYEIFVKRIRRIFEIAAHMGVDVLILGAFGCGAYHNPPEIVARAFKEVQKEYLNRFAVIEYAVYCRRSDSYSFSVFNEILGEE